MRRLIIRLQTGLIVFLLGMEALLRLFDPLGLRYFQNLQYLYNYYESSSTRIFELKAGDYTLNGWRVRELANGQRNVPDNPDGACTLVFVGDSVTWGEGVDDSAVWVNLVAKQLPGINVIDAASLFYNSENVRGSVKDYPDAQAIIYFIIGNDPEVTVTQIPRGVSNASALSYYLTYLLNPTGGYNPSEDWPRFYRDLDAMRGDPHVTFVAFDAPFGRELAARYPVKLIPIYTHWLSYVDTHANVEGNQQIAAGILPIAQAVVKDKCGG